LYELLKDTAGKEGLVHMVQGEAGWKTRKRPGWKTRGRR
jgi:hypothetical protein